MGNKIIGIAVAVMIAVAVLVQLQGSIALSFADAVYDCGVDTICGGANSADDTLITAAGVFNGTVVGSLLTLIPLVIVAGLLGYAYFNKS